MSEQNKPLRPESEGSVVWRQFKKRKIGVVSLYVILVLFAIAVYGPILANHNPLALKTTYGVLYNNYYEGLNTVHDLVHEAISQRTILEKERDEAQAGYSSQRSKLEELSAALATAGNEYAEYRGRVNRLRDRISEQGDRLKALEENGADAAARQVLVDARDKLRAEAAEQEDLVKKAGAEEARIKRELDLERSRLEAHNLVLVRTRFRLDLKAHERALMRNLEQMHFMVDAETQGRLAMVTSRYEALFTRLGGSPGSGAAMLGELQELGQLVRSELNMNRVRAHLVYRWTFPALASLDALDRMLMVGYGLLLVFFFLGSRLPGTLKQKGIVILLVSMASSALFQQLSAELPERNYKTFLLDNIRAGYSESEAYMPPVPYGLNENRVEEKLQRPSWYPDKQGRRSLHAMGTDDYGRDVLSRMIWGARVSLSVGFVAVGLYVTIGIIIGAMAGYFGGWVDILVSRVIEIVMCFPSFFLIIAVIAFVGPSIYNIMIVIGLTSWTGIARLTRGEFLRLRKQEFVLAGQAAGIRPVSLMFKYILPNALTPVMVAAAFGFAGSILTESGLSFLGFGVQEPFPSWGQMLSDSQSNPILYWWMFIVPGTALFLTVTFYNLAGNAFRDAADPRLRK